jgi:hypothetical protein
MTTEETILQLLAKHDMLFDLFTKGTLAMCGVFAFLIICELVRPQEQ